MNGVWNTFVSAGVFALPLAIFFILAIFIICDRCVYVRRCNVMPHEVLKVILNGAEPNLIECEQTVVGRIIKFCNECKPEPEALKAYVQYEISNLERGMFLLDIVISGAPLIGLLGTVTGLTSVFGNFSFAIVGGNTDLLVSGIALALTTTMLGLSIAIPGIIGSGYINRKIDKFAAELEIVVERLIDINLSK